MRQEGCRLPTAGDIAEIKVGSITAHLRFTEMEAFRVAARFLDQRPPSITTACVPADCRYDRFMPNGSA
jgi:hypothetical protein